MCLRLVFLLIMRLAAWLRLSRREETWKTAEILILRHQLAVLQRRQPRRPKLNWADRALPATLLSVIPNARRHGLRPRGLVGSGQTGTALTSGRLARDAPDVLSGHIQQVRRNGHVTSGEHQPGTLNPLTDQIRMPGRVLRDSPVHDLGLRHIGERGQVADALLRLPAHLDRRLTSHHTQLLTVPREYKYLSIRSTLVARPG